MNGGDKSIAMWCLYVVKIVALSSWRLLQPLEISLSILRKETSCYLTIMWEITLGICVLCLLTYDFMPLRSCLVFSSRFLQLCLDLILTPASFLPSSSSYSGNPLQDGKNNALFKRDLHPVIVRMIEIKEIPIDKEANESLKSTKTHIFDADVELSRNDISCHDAPSLNALGKIRLSRMSPRSSLLFIPIILDQILGFLFLAFGAAFPILQSWIMPIDLECHVTCKFFPYAMSSYRHCDAPNYTGGLKCVS